MFSSSLLTGLGISGVSTGVYAAFTSEYEENKYKDRNFKYIGQVKDDFWIDVENKGKTTT